MTQRRGRGRPPHPDLLTPAEWEVLDWVRHGLRRGEIARLRGTSVDAVKYHLANISDKLGVPGTAHLRHWPGMPATTPRTTRSTSEPMSTRLGPIGQIALSIRDVERAERFYGDVLGLQHLFTFGDLAFFDAAGTRLYLQRRADDAWRPGSTLYFTVDDIQAAREDLAAGGVRFTDAPHKIHTHDDGTEEWMTFFEDGEGNTHALMASIRPS